MATAQSASELKQQGALEAARDPEVAVSSDDAQRKILEESKKAGVVAFTFDPNASVEQKRAQARAALPEGMPHRPKGTALATDIDDGSRPDVELPSPSREGAVAVERDENGNEVANGRDGGHGDAEFGEQTGWAPRFGWPSESSLESASLMDHSTWVETQLPDHLFGEWYHNAAVIFFACISSWLVAVLGAGIGWIFIIGAICATYYRTSIRRVRRNFRDDITRELGLKKLDTDNESVEWMNSFMVKFWPIYQPVLAQTIINSVDQVLSASTPAFLDSLKLKTFTLGSKPPRIDHVRTYPKAEDDVVLMDWQFSFTPNDTADMTAKQIKNKINPKVVLEIRVGKAMISKGLDVILEDMAFSGNMRIKMKLQIPFPHIEKVEMCFLDRPVIDYVCKPLGGETFGFDINFIPGLESFIQEQIHATLSPMMYAPNVFPIEVAKMLAGTPVDQAVGVVALTLHGAQGLKNPDNFSGTPDPYAIVSINRRQPLAQTKVIKENANPRWNETHYVVVSSLNEPLDMQVFDYNDFRKDKELGVASFQLENLEDVFEYENERLELIHDGKARGVLFCDVRFFPVLEPKKLPDGTEETMPDSNTGILRFTVEQAKDLDGTKSLVGLLNPYAQLLLNGKEVHVTKKLKRTNNPIWDNGSKETLITDRRTAKLGVAIKDDRDIAGDQVIGTYQIKLDDMLDLMAKGQEWYNLAAAKSGRVKMMAQWKPVAISGIAVGTGGYMTPIGVLRLHFKSAKDLRNFEALGKSDPYARVLLSGIERARTVTFKNNLNPEWDEVLYVPVHSPRERVQIEVMDAENMGRDRSLGLTEIFSADFMAQDDNGEWLVHDQKTLRQDGLKMHGKGIPKGLLNYTVSFYPCLNVADPEKEEDEGDKARDLLTPEPQAKPSADIPRSPDAGRFSTNLVGRGEGDRDSSSKGSNTPVEPPKSPLTPSTSLSPVSSRRSHDRAPPKVHLTPEELLKYESGLLIVKLMEADFPRSQSRVEIFVDDMAFPSYVSSKTKSKGYMFDEIGDCFIRELEFSKLTIKVCERNEKQDEGGKNHVLARLTGNTLDTLKQCLNNPTTLKMKDDHGNVYSVKVSLKYVPVKMQLDPSESINNMGNLRVDVLDAQDLPSGDSNGKSDPYVKFELNGQDVFKSKVQKKTLSPIWNEFFEVPVPSRTAAKFKAVVWDWDFADKPDFLGAAEINLDQLDPFKAQELKLVLDGKSGMLRVRLLFRPDYVTRTRHGTSTFSGTFAAPTRIVTGVAGVPMRGTVAVAHGVGKGASFIKRGFRGGSTAKSKDDFEDGMVASSDIPTITTNGADPAPGMGLKRSTGLSTIGKPDGTPPSPPSSIPPGPAISTNGATRNHARTKSFGASSTRSALMPGAASGVATFTVVSASNFSHATDLLVSIVQLRDSKTKAVGKTKHRKTSSSGTAVFDETFRVSCSPDNQFRVEVKEHHTFGSDAPLGDALFFVDETGSGQEREVRVGAGGIVAIRSSFEPADGSSLTSAGSGVPNAEASPRPSTAHGVKRRSFLGSRRDNRGSRETTPV